MRLCVDDPAIRKPAHERMRDSSKASRLRADWNFPRRWDSPEESMAGATGLEPATFDVTGRTKFNGINDSCKFFCG